MKQIRYILPLAVLLNIYGVYAEQSIVEGMLTQEAGTEQNTPKVTAVYGVTADDYLPNVEVARKHLRPKLRRPASRPSFDLPDAFYFIGGPIFLLILLRVLVIFLNGFEEKRKEELRAVASQNPHPE